MGINYTPLLRRWSLCGVNKENWTHRVVFNAKCAFPSCETRREWRDIRPALPHSYKAVRNRNFDPFRFLFQAFNTNSGNNLRVSREIYDVNQPLIVQHNFCSNSEWIAFILWSAGHSEANCLVMCSFRSPKFTVEEVVPTQFILAGLYELFNSIGDSYIKDKVPAGELNYMFHNLNYVITKELSKWCYGVGSWKILP